MLITGEAGSVGNEGYVENLYVFHRMLLWILHCSTRSVLKKKTYESEDIVEIFVQSDHESICAEGQNKMLLWIVENNVLLSSPKDHWFWWVIMNVKLIFPLNKGLSREQRARVWPWFWNWTLSPLSSLPDLSFLSSV